MADLVAKLEEAIQQVRDALEIAERKEMIPMIESIRERLRELEGKPVES